MKYYYYYYTHTHTRENEPDPTVTLCSLNRSVMVWDISSTL